MSDRIDDIMAESRWEEALKSFLEDFMTFRAAFIERTVQKVSELEFSDLGGVTTASVMEREKIVFESLSRLGTGKVFVSPCCATRAMRVAHCFSD
jgi:hypothetical protein